jgi:glutathione S-transferase
VTFKCVDPDYIDAIPDVAARTMVVRHKERKFGRGCVERWREGRENMRAEAVRHFSYFDNMLESKPFLLGDSPVFSDFLLYGMTGNYTYRGINQIPAQLQALSAWQARLAAWRG